MPYESKSQMKKFFAMEDRGELPEGTAREWAHHTPHLKKLPEHKGHSGRSKRSEDYLKEAGMGGIQAAGTAVKPTMPGITAAMGGGAVPRRGVIGDFNGTGVRPGIGGGRGGITGANQGIYGEMTGGAQPPPGQAGGQPPGQPGGLGAMLASGLGRFFGGGQGGAPRPDPVTASSDPRSMMGQQAPPRPDPVTASQDPRSMMGQQAPLPAPSAMGQG
jgi:hypothetical protein